MELSSLKLKKRDWSDSEDKKVTKPIEFFEEVIFEFNNKYYKILEKENQLNCTECKYNEENACYRYKLVFERESEQCIITCVEDFQVVEVDKKEILELKLKGYEIFKYKEQEKKC